MTTHDQLPTVGQTAPESELEQLQRRLRAAPSRLSLRALAKICGCSHESIRNFMNLKDPNKSGMAYKKVMSMKKGLDENGL